MVNKKGDVMKKKFLLVLLQILILNFLLYSSGEAINLYTKMRENESESFLKGWADTAYEEDSSFSTEPPSVGAGGAATDNQAYSKGYSWSGVFPNEDLQSNDKVTFGVTLKTEGEMYSWPGYYYDDEGHLIRIGPASYSGGTYAGFESTIIPTPSEDKKHSFWGKETRGMPVYVKWNYYDKVSIVDSFNFHARTYHQDYYYGKEAFEETYGFKFNGAGSNSLVYCQLPKQFRVNSDEVLRKRSEMNRTASSCTTNANIGPAFPGMHSSFTPEYNGSESFLTQLENEITLFAESEFKVTTDKGTLSSKFDYQSELSHSWEVSLIPKENVRINLIPNVSEIVQRPEKGYECRHASKAMVAKYIAKRENILSELYQDYHLPSNDEEGLDEAIMGEFLSYESLLSPRNIWDYLSCSFSPPGEIEAIHMNRYLNKRINPKLKKQGKKLIATHKNFKSIKEEELISLNYPGILFGPIYDNVNEEVSGHESVVYGGLGIKEPESDNTDFTWWIALHDTWSYPPVVRTEKGKRIWIQEGGEELSRNGYSSIEWWPAPDVKSREELLFPEWGGGWEGFPKKSWEWTDFILIEEIEKVRSLSEINFDDLESYPQLVKEGVNIVSSPWSSNKKDGALYLISPTGSPIEIDLVETIFPADFEIGFEYAGEGNGILKILLDENLLDIIDLSSLNLTSLLTYDKTFSILNYGLTPYELHNLSLVLKGASDPEVYIDNLYIRNLNVIPEPSSLILLVSGIGLISLCKNRRHIH